MRREGRTIRLGVLDRKILEIVTRARFIDAGQIVALLGEYRPNTIQARLTLLFDTGYLDRPEPQRELAVRPGTASIVYAVGAKGAALAGVPPKKNDVSLIFLKHTLLVSRAYSATAAACRHAGIELDSWENEAELPSLELPGFKEEVQHAADAFCIARLPGGFDHFFVEVDRGTEPGVRSDPRQTSVWKMVLYYQTLHRQAEALIGIRNFRVLLITHSIGRIESIQELCRRADGDKAGLGIFWLSLHDLVKPDDPQGFLNPIWCKPSSGLYPLWTPEQLGTPPLYRAALPEGLPGAASVLT